MKNKVVSIREKVKIVGKVVDIYIRINMIVAVRKNSRAISIIADLADRGLSSKSAKESTFLLQKYLEKVEKSADLAEPWRETFAEVWRVVSQRDASSSIIYNYRCLICQASESLAPHVLSPIAEAVVSEGPQSLMVWLDCMETYRHHSLRPDDLLLEILKGPVKSDPDWVPKMIGFLDDCLQWVNERVDYNVGDWEKNTELQNIKVRIRKLIKDVLNKIDRSAYLSFFGAQAYKELILFLKDHRGLLKAAESYAVVEPADLFFLRGAINRDVAEKLVASSSHPEFRADACWIPVTICEDDTTDSPYSKHSQERKGLLREEIRRGRIFNLRNLGQLSAVPDFLQTVYDYLDNHTGLLENAPEAVFLMPAHSPVNSVCLAEQLHNRAMRSKKGEPFIWFKGVGLGKIEDETFPRASFGLDPNRKLVASQFRGGESCGSHFDGMDNWYRVRTASKALRDNNPQACAVMQRYNFRLENYIIPVATFVPLALPVYDGVGKQADLWPQKRALQLSGVNPFWSSMQVVGVYHTITRYRISELEENSGLIAEELKTLSQHHSLECLDEQTQRLEIMLRSAASYAFYVLALRAINGAGSNRGASIFSSFNRDLLGGRDSEGLSVVSEFSKITDLPTWQRRDRERAYDSARGLPPSLQFPEAKQLFNLIVAQDFGGALSLGERVLA